jgi:NAD(P)H dehydrogenase (quinone)
MKILIVYAHPDTGGHCPTFLSETKSWLDAAKAQGVQLEYQVLDLYKMMYNPVLHEEEHYTRGHRFMSKQNLEIQAMIKAADKLIFIYPVWWGSMPAILKGFFDKTLTSRFAFQYINGVPHGLLTDKKALVFMTSGSPMLISELFLGNRYHLAIKIDILGFCGIKCRIAHLGMSLQFTPERADKIKRMVNLELKKFIK